MPYQPPPDLAGLSLEQIAQLNAERKLPPVDQWHPAVKSDSLMEIKADGRWLHDGGEIKRPAMVRAFASLLRRDAGGQHWLVTPTDMQSVAVEDAAFMAIDVARQGTGMAPQGAGMAPQGGALIFQLNTDDVVIASAEHPLIARGSADLPAIYLAVRHGTEARINRSTWLQLVEFADADLSVTSQGTKFSLVPG